MMDDPGNANQRCGGIHATRLAQVRPGTHPDKERWREQGGQITLLHNTHHHGHCSMHDCSMG